MRNAARTVATISAAAWLFLLAPGAQGAMLSLVPSVITTTEGGSIEIEVVISDLGAFAAPSLSGFDLEILYDPAFLAATAVSFGDPVHGDQLDLFGLGPLFMFSDLSTPGVAAIAEVSFDDPGDLDTLQEASFILATIEFTALMATAPGIPTLVSVGGSPGSLVGLGALIIDSLAVPLTPVFLEGAEVTIESAAVPVTGTLALVFLGLCGCMVAGRSRPT